MGLFNCKKGHQFESEEATPKVCPTCEEQRMRYSRTNFLAKRDRQDRKLEDAGISTNDRARRCEGCSGLLKGYSHVEVDDADGRRVMVCDRCSHEAEFEPNDDRYASRPNGTSAR